MNRSALNSTVLGTGNKLPWIIASAQQALRLVGTFAVSLTKYGQGSSSLALNGALTPTQQVLMAFSGVLTATGTLTATILRESLAAVNSVLRLVGVVTLRLEVVGRATQSNALNGTLTPTIYSIKYGQIAQSMKMSFTAVGYDLYTGAAPDYRTTGIVEIKTQTTGTVGIGV